MRLWPLFGTTNQLTGALSLFVISLFLLALGRRIWITALPMGFLLVMTTWAMVLNLVRYATDNQTLLLVVAAAVFALELWLILEAGAALKRAVGRRRARGVEGETASPEPPSL